MINKLFTEGHEIFLERMTNHIEIQKSLSWKVLEPWRKVRNSLELSCSWQQRTCNLRRQQTRFYWVFSWELMESATIHTFPPILLSVRTKYSWRTRIWKNIYAISMYGENSYQIQVPQWQLLQPLNNLEKGILFCPSSMQTVKAQVSLISVLLLLIA